MTLMEGTVLGFVDHTHPAFAEFLEDLVVGYGLADHVTNRSFLGTIGTADSTADDRRKVLFLKKLPLDFAP